MTYREMMDEENDEIMRDVRDRQAQVRELYRLFAGDREGLRRHEEAALAKLGFKVVPTGRGTTTVVPMEG
jgi:hypothetical protein